MANPRMTAEIGRVLGGRYRLVAPIGMGASAQVYLADDVKLRRRVAVKMLHDALAGDAEFLRRFRAEARAAAALSHPNIMAVYDWSDGSEDGDAAFIVTEYLAGGSLRSLLDGGGVLDPSQALLVGLEASRALDYAHRRGFVHRDIKPANLLFGDDERLRIADFGLARALAEAAWTEPQGAVLGTARYASPEQAKGETLSGKADVYSLALVLIEAVTGEVPFVADTTLGTLMARVDKQVPVPEELGPLHDVLVGAGRPDPTERIDARALAAGLLRAARQLSRPAPLPLVGALAAGAGLASDADPTVHGPLSDAGAEPAVQLAPDDLDLDPPHWVSGAEPATVAAGIAAGAGSAAIADGPAVAPPIEPEPSSEVIDVREAPDLTAEQRSELAEIAPDVAPDTTVDLTAYEPSPVVPLAESELTGPDGRGTDEVPVVPDGGSHLDGDGTDDGEGRRRRRWPWAVLIVLLVAVAGGAAYGLTRQADQAQSVLPVPRLEGRTEAQARAVAEGAGWKVRVVRKRQDGSTKGEVLSTTPSAGTRLEQGRTLTLTVSQGQTIVDVPQDLAGKTLADATAELARVGLEPKVAEERYSEDVADNVVIGIPNGTATRMEKGSTVPLVVSKGPEPRTIPSGLVGSTEAEATAALQKLKLVPEIVRSYSDSVAKGTVISVLPKAGTQVDRGSSVSVEVSKGPELVAVPSIKGAAGISQAVAILQKAGLQAGSVSGPAAGSPVGTSPAAGTMVRPGSTVDIILG